MKKSKEFDKLISLREPDKTGICNNGPYAEYHYTNGYGASVICSDISYGGTKGLLELAVLKGDNLDYSTPITDAVIGYLDATQVIKLLTKISELPILMTDQNGGTVNA